jgi:hypothetical protein
MKLSEWEDRLEAFAAARREMVETQSSRRERGWMPQEYPWPPVNGEIFPLTPPFIEHSHRADGGFYSQGRREEKMKLKPNSS